MFLLLSFFCCFYNFCSSSLLLLVSASIHYKFLLFFLIDKVIVRICTIIITAGRKIYLNQYFCHLHYCHWWWWKNMFDLQYQWLAMKKAMATILALWYVTYTSYIAPCLVSVEAAYKLYLLMLLDMINCWNEEEEKEKHNARTHNENAPWYKSKYSTNIYIY